MAVTPERRRLLLLIALLIPLGLLAKRAPSTPVGYWFDWHGAAILYEMFWVAVLALACPRARAARLGAGVCLATCGLEFLQLWHPAPLQAFRHTFLGEALIGSTFDPWDFPYYLLGSAVGAGLVWLARRRPVTSDQ